MNRAIATIALLLATGAFGQDISPKQETANLWVYVTNASFGGLPMDTVDVTVDSAFDIGAMALSVHLVANGKSHEFGFSEAIYADGGPVTSDAHFSPTIAPAEVTGARATVGMFSGRALKCAKQDSSTPSRAVLACVFRN